MIGNRLAWAVLVAVLCGYTAWDIGFIVHLGYGARLTALAIGNAVLVMALQLYHSGAIRQNARPRAWPVTLGLQAVLVYAFLFPFVWAQLVFTGPFLAGSILLLVPGRWRWAGYAAVVASYSVLLTVLPLRGPPSAPGQQIPLGIYYGALTAGIGLMVYGLSRLAGLAAQLEALNGELARMTAVAERLRIARDVHDLLGLGLSAIALKTDLIVRLIGRDNAQAAAEIDQVSRICASSQADTRLVTGDGQTLSLASELDAARHILTSAGVEVCAGIATGPLSAAADGVLATVLREAVTNILRHSSAKTCTIEATASDGLLWLQVSNDGAASPASTAQAGASERPGRGLANLTTRVQAASGRLTSRCQDGQFHLTAELPVSRAQDASPAASPLPGHQPT